MKFLTRSRWLSFLVLLLILAVSLSACKVIPEGQEEGAKIKLPQAKTLTNTTWIEIDRAMQKAIAAHDDIPAYTIFRVAIDDVKLSADGTLAVVWTSLVDRKTGEVQSAEPGLVIAHKTKAEKWKIVLQSDAAFAAELKALPSDLMPDDEKALFAPAAQPQAKSGVVYRGYKLPWPAGQTKRLTGSIGHVLTYKTCPSTCLYAFDFADGTMFTLAAAKAGTVKYAEWRYPNGNTTNTNYLVLEDTTTTPTTYQVYYHLAQNSIPAALRVVGAKVYQGQFIGNADDTGVSTGNHLHFMVHTSTNSVWGTSVDIVFDEVTVNGGRPRTCAEAEAYPAYGSQCMPGNLYTSQNGDNAIPTGAITSPANGSTITTPAVNVTGWMKDDVAVDHGQLMYSLDGTWNAVGAVLTGNTFSTSLDLCDLKVPNGKFSLSLVVTDKAGKTSAANTGLISLTQNYKCPVAPPTCVPAANQAALYLQEDFQGNCQLLDIGKYTDLDKLSVVKSNQARSLKLGSGVSVSLYPEKNLGGSLDFFQASDADLSDNAIGSQKASSAIVYARIQPPAVPSLTLPQEASSEDDLTLQWSVQEGVETGADLTGPNNYSSHLDWQTTGSWHIGPLPAGSYTLTVNARNLAGTAKVSQAFTVVKALVLPVVSLQGLPALSNDTAIRLNWKVESGAASLDHFEIQVRRDKNDWETWSNKPGASTLTTVYTGYTGSTYSFRIRGVTAAGKGVDFATVPVVTIQLDTHCSDDRYEGTKPGDDQRDSAAPITLGDVQEHNWCPVGDVDWVAFQATAGQVLDLTTSARGLNAAAALQLYNTDGSTLLGEVHPVDENASASLEWTVPADGVYYVRLSPENALVGGDDTVYTFTVKVNSQVNPGLLVCSSITLPAALGGGFVMAKKARDKKKASKRAGWK